MPPSPPTPPRVDLVLHLGMGKTGTTSVQFFLRDNRERLAEAGLLYPRTPGRARHGRLGLYARPDEELADAPHWARENAADPARFRRRFRRRLYNEIEESGLTRVLMSDEELFGASPRTLRRLGRFSGSLTDGLRVVVYLRRQDDHMVSRYQQGVKIGWVSRLETWAREDMGSLYDYAGRLQRLDDLLAPADLVVRRFETSAFVDESLHRDFLHAVGLDVPVSAWEQPARRNTSLDAESVEFLRLLNLHRVEQEGATPGLIDNRALVARLAAAGGGPTLTLAEPVLDEFMAQWAVTNHHVATRHLGDPDGRLFREPRRTAGTTTAQLLDPSRLDHFLAVGEIADDLHEPLRRLALREVSRA